LGKIQRGMLPVSFESVNHARDLYEQALAIAQRLTKSDPRNQTWRRNAQWKADLEWLRDRLAAPKVPASRRNARASSRMAATAMLRSPWAEAG
jgi:hypothetical protein